MTSFFVKEFQLIEKFFKPLTKNQKAARALADDVAQIGDLVISKDVFVEDVHFLLADGGFRIASKLLRTNLSDLAAAGAIPLCYMLGLSKNAHVDEKFMRDFSRGLESVQNEFGLYLIGGDTVHAEKLVFSITIFGKIKNNKILSRNAAKSGDLIYVSGKIGEAFLGLKVKQRNLPLTPYYLPLLNRHFFPIPRLKLGQDLISKNLSRCAIDVSDGLLADLQHICKASQLKAEIHLETIPLPVTTENPLKLITAGDDYELIFAVNPKNQEKIAKLGSKIGLDLTCIGRFTESNKHKVILYQQNRRIKLTKLGYEH
ncbi:MAG: thiamine-phosphate kinase [Alphaproteobacteria bacterium]|nr:thiamine-phosphate kinase [Alphaproteobacteria bacterium]